MQSGIIMMLHNNSTNNMTTGWCPEVCDKWKCWPSTQPGTNATMGCPKIEGTLENAKAYKYCDLTGSWETRNSTNGTYDYTHYENCILPQIQELAKMCDKFGETTCSQIGKITRCIEMVGLSFSFVSLVISLYIFFSYRVLKNNRTKIHKNLFIATLLQVIFRLIKYIDQGLDPTNKFIHKLYLNETCICLLEYTKTAMFMWMFIEGLYLHNMITVTVFQEYTYIKIYCYIGWIVPGLMTAAWLIFMLVKEAKTKAVRAAIFLLPLMGISHILFFYYKFNEAWKFALWSFTSYFLGTFQGFFVAILYCFLNGEVQTAIKNSFYLHMSLRNYDYTPCRNFTLISITADDGNVQNGKASNWIRCCKQAPPSPEEKEISTSRSNWSSKHTVEETDTSLMEVKDTTE
ncbi:pigment-dispersing factor receptor isoform X2 [Leptinotarsa decemlineata]|uniref:pigment-dispersing factor receptor isoform X2 n=1 Tax=Leptinotarsa decemlineata TaxID=7539 RepID=UPI003D308202